MSKEIAQKALAIKALEEYYKPQRESLVEFMKYMWKEEKKQDLQIPKHYYDIEDKLTKMLNGEITRLIINVPPRTGKTLMITELFPVWAMGRKESSDFIVTGYSTSLTREFSGHARDWYASPSYRRIFPRAVEMRDDQNTKEYWRNDDNQSYYATGAGGSITGRGCDIFIIDDPIKPDEADTSELQRDSVNNWYLNTVQSRLNNPRTGGIILIMQRTHENDLAGFLMEREEKGLEKWDKVIVPAIQPNGESIEPERFPLDILQKMQEENPVVFTTQYQQQPQSALTQEIYPDEWWRSFDFPPTDGYLYAVVDPAFSEKKHADSAVITIGRAHEGLLHVEDVIGMKAEVNELIEACVMAARKWKPIKFGVESYGAQKALADLLRKRFREEGLHTTIEDFKQEGTKADKIRANLVNPMRSGKILFKEPIPHRDEIYKEMKAFPRGAHDDYIDSIQMLYAFCDLQPHIKLEVQMPKIEYDSQGAPVYNAPSSNFL